MKAFFGEWRSNENEPETFVVTSTTLFNHPDYLDSSDGNSKNTDYCLIKVFTEKRKFHILRKLFL